MRTLANAHSSRIVSALQSAPVRRANNVGDAQFISFITLQAALPKGAPLVVQALEAEITKGYRLDETLTGILHKAKATMRLFPQALAIQ